MRHLSCCRLVPRIEPRVTLSLSHVPSYVALSSHELVCLVCGTAAPVTRTVLHLGPADPHIGFPQAASSWAAGLLGRQPPGGGKLRLWEALHPPPADAGLARWLWGGTSKVSPQVSRWDRALWGWSL